jgi:hypothetical protein
MPKATKSELSLVDARSMTRNEARLTPEEIRRLLAITVDLLAICGRVSGRIDPAVGAMIAYAHDEVLENAVAGPL